MLKRTHLAIGVALSVYFLPLVTYTLIFVPIVILSSLFPDIDSMYSTIGRRKIFRPIQLFFGHRGPLHSYTFGIALSLLIALFYPIAALPFFVGYSFHLLADSFTINGIRPFWPAKFNSSGVIRTGGHMDKIIFFTFVIIDTFLILMLFI